MFCSWELMRETFKFNIVDQHMGVVAFSGSTGVDLHIFIHREFTSTEFQKFKVNSSFGFSGKS